MRCPKCDSALEAVVDLGQVESYEVERAYTREQGPRGRPVSPSHDLRGRAWGEIRCSNPECRHEESRFELVSMEIRKRG